MEKNKQIIEFYSNIGRNYVSNILSIVDINRLKQNQDYANKMFFYYWAFERQGALIVYKIATIKAIETVKNGNNSEGFFKY